MPTEYLAIIFLAAGFVVAAVLTAYLIPILRQLAIDRGWVDRPDGERKIHKQPIPSVGGVAIASGFLGGLLCLVVFGELSPSFTLGLNTSFFVGAALTAAVGFYDDVKGVSFKQKFAAQVVIALFLIQAGYRIDMGWLIQGDPYNEALFSSALTMLWIVGIMNAVNLIDGMDGLAGGVVLIAFVSLGVIFGLQGQLGLVAIAVVMIGALAAFLAYNFNPASIFMGDTGSLFLGYVIAAFSLHVPAHADPLIALLVPVMVLGLPVLDTTLSVVRRFSRGHAIFAPDKDHLHHRLSERWAPRQTVLLLYGAASFFGAMAILMAVSTPVVAFGVLGVASTTTFAVVRRLGYQPTVIVEDIRRRFVAPKLQTMKAEELEFAPSHAVGTSKDYASSDGAPSGDGAAGGDGVSRTTLPTLNVEKLDPESSVDLDSVVALDKDVTSADLDGEMVVLSLRTGSYFGLNQAGSSIMQLLKDEPRTVESIVDGLQEKYSADRDLLQRDVVGFLGQMRRRNLIRDVGSRAV